MLVREREESTDQQQWGRDKAQVQCWCWTRLISTIFGLCMCIARYSTMIPAYVIIAIAAELWYPRSRQWLSLAASFSPTTGPLSDLLWCANVLSWYTTVVRLSALTVWFIGMVVVTSEQLLVHTIRFSKSERYFKQRFCYGPIEKIK